jgi:hypothetical protein
MKAILDIDGSFLRLVPDSIQSDQTRTRVWVPTEPPAVSANEVLEELTPEITETHATQRWNVRPKTDAEAQTVATQLTIWQSALWSMADLEGPVGDTALLILGALMSATETESRNPATKQLLGAAIQLGIVADIDRARVILNDPGFTLQ